MIFRIRPKLKTKKQKKNSVELMLTMNAMNNMNTKDKSHFIMELSSETPRNILIEVKI